jgi:uncharacterized membrane protein YccF (DUF307 family)
MRLLLNILWIVLGGGFVLWLEYVLAGVILCVTIVGIPFGKDIDATVGSVSGGVLRTVFNVIWLLVAGIWIFLTHIGLAIALAVSIIGIPFAVQHLKLALMALWPFGRQTRTA